MLRYAAVLGQTFATAKLLACYVRAAVSKPTICETKKWQMGLWQCQSLADNTNKSACSFEGCGGLLRRNLGTGAGLVIGNSFQVIGLRKKNSLVGRKARIVLGQA